MDFSYFDSFIEEEVGPAEEAEGLGWRNVWVVAEVADGALTPATIQAMSAGRDLADSIGVYLYGVVMGSGVEDEAQALIRYGADKVYLADDPALAQYHVETYTKVLADLVTARQPEIVLLPATSLGNDLAPRLAQRLDTGLFSGCLKVEMDMAERHLLGITPLMGGQYFQTVACPSARPQIATLQPGCFRPAYEDTYRSGEVETVGVELDGVSGQLDWVDMAVRVEVPTPPLERARIVVSGGRGLGDADGFKRVQELAEVLGGAVAGSRGAFDEGWIGEEQQVGVAGAWIAPDLYVACGISGDVFHYFGFQDATFVVAINKDPDAPIFKVANVGIVGDAREVLPALIEAVKAA